MSHPHAVLAKPSVAIPWNTYAPSLGPQIWLKLDENTRTATVADASGNGRDFFYPNGTYAPLDIPNRGETALVAGSTFSITPEEAGNSELVATGTTATYLRTLFSAGSWTFGAFVKTTATLGRAYQWGFNQWVLAVGFNRNLQTGTTVAGTLSLSYDSSGADAGTLVATGCGWNDGTTRALFAEYDSVANTISLWLGGTKIATKTRVGTKPTSGTLSGDFNVKDALGILGVKLDEMLFFDKVLTSGEHLAIAAYAV